VSELPIEVPNAEILQLSSVVLSDLIERVPTRNAGSGQFVVGDYKLRPRVDGVFHGDETLGVFFKFLRLNESPVEFELVQKGANNVLAHKAEPAQLTMRESFDLSALAPGQYLLRIKAGADLTRSVPFEIR
jgi:hypothetical protein